MHESANQPPRRFPSRRSLRTPAERPDTEQPDAERSVQQETASQQDPHAAPATLPAVRVSSSNDTSALSLPDVVYSPLIEHVPDAAPPEHQEPQQRRSFGRTLATSVAALSVTGLVLAGALPLTEYALPNEPSQAAAQLLFSGSDAPADMIPESLGDITTGAVESSAPLSFDFKPNAWVNFPIPETVLLTDGFGYRTAPIAQFHDAQDFAASAGTPVHAIAEGTVLEAGFADDGCGFALKLEHSIDDQEVTSRYCHMQMASNSLQTGDKVAMGEMVGRVGNTGMSFGPHLHLAIRVNDEPVDPLVYIPKYNRLDRESPKPSTNTRASGSR